MVPSFLLSIGIYGLDFYVVLGRAGYNINQRRKQKSTIGPNHRVTQEEAMKWYEMVHGNRIIKGNDNAI